jgi:hypothetical protein
MFSGALGLEPGPQSTVCPRYPPGGGGLLCSLFVAQSHIRALLCFPMTYLQYEHDPDYESRYLEAEKGDNSAAYFRYKLGDTSNSFGTSV